MKPLKSKALSGLLILLVLFTQMGAFADTATAAPTAIDSGIDYLKLMIQYSKQNYYKELSDDAILEAIYKGLYGSMDEHSVYFTPEEYKSFGEDITGSYEGIGVSVVQDGEYIRVAKPLTGGPSIKAGIQTGDIIISVDGTDIKGFGMEKAVALIKGPAGTSVRIGIVRKGVVGTLYFDLVRAKIDVSPVTTEIKGDVGYILLDQFTSDSSTYIQLALVDLKAKGIQKVILDLRNNPGGSLDQVVNIVDYFAPKGSTIVRVDYRSIPDKVYTAQLDPYAFELAVLVNEYSASASEILAAAVKELKLGTVIGTKTYGKGTVQNLLPITNGGAIKMTVAEYFTPNNNPVDKIGVTPDFVVTNVPNTFEAVIRNFAPMYSLDVYKKGMKGLDVKGMQERLKYMGYNITNADGVFTENTYTMLRLFEQYNKMTVDGILDEVTKKRIDDVLKTKIKPAADLQLNKALEVLK